MDSLELEQALHFSQLKRKLRNAKQKVSHQRKRLLSFQLSSFDSEVVPKNREDQKQDQKFCCDDFLDPSIDDRFMYAADEFADADDEFIYGDAEQELNYMNRDIENIADDCTLGHDENTNASIDESGDLEKMNDFDLDISDYQDDTEIDDLSTCRSNESIRNSDSPLHNFTNLSTADYCESFSSLARKAQLCKLRANEFLSLIKSGLPVPNQLPSTEKELLSLLNVDDIFTKKSICLLCTDYFDYRNKICPKCRSNDKASIAHIYDADVKSILMKICTRLSSYIHEYKSKINENNIEGKTKDVPFGILYQDLLEKNRDKNILSLLLHLDGIGITRSTKLKMWMFSGAILELPPKIRYRRFNMILISIWVGYIEPPAQLWLKTSIESLKSIKTKVFNVESVGYHLKIYGITGDCPALKLICNFIGHNGYFCCYFCFVKGEHINGKRQYHYSTLNMRSVGDYSKAAKKAEGTQQNVFGHLGESILQSVVDIPLPKCIVLDYLHVTLLGHAKAIILSIYRQLTPAQRRIFDSQVKNQNFPHFFHRKARSVDSFAFVKGTEVRNLLFYGLLSNLDALLSIDKLAHLALYVCMIRLLHHGNIFGNRTSELADKLFVEFYKDHELFYDGLQNFKLHLHSHFSMMNEMHGAFSMISCFGPEDLIGSVSANSHGTKYYGDSITYYYNIDFHLQNKKKQNKIKNGPCDLSSTIPSAYGFVEPIHHSMCDCHDVNSCFKIYRRFLIRNAMFHSLIYQKKHDSVSYFVQYLFDENNDYRFGIIELFFIHNDRSYAVIRYHRLKQLYSEFFKHSTYYFLLKKPLDALYFILEKHHCQLDVVQTDQIVGHCIIIEKSDHIFATTFSSYDEHD